MDQDNPHTMLTPLPPAGPAPAAARDYYPAEEEPERHLRDYWRVIVKRRWWVLGFCLGLVFLTVLICFLMTPIYKSTATLQIIKDNPGSLVEGKNALASLSGDRYDQNFYETQFKILTSRDLAKRVIKALNLPEHPEFKLLKEKRPEQSPQELASDMVELFRDKLNIEPVKNSYLVEISFKSTDQALCRQVVEAMAREYVQFNMDLRNQSFTVVKDWLQDQLRQLADKVDASQKRLFDYSRKNDIFLPEEKNNVVITKFIELGSLLTKAQSETMAKQAQYSQVKEKGVDAPLIVNHPLIQGLRRETVHQDAKVAGMAKIYREGHPQMLAERATQHEIKGRLKGEVNRVLSALKADYEAAARTDNLLKEAFEAQKQQVADLQEKSIHYKILKRDVETYDTLYQGLLARMKDAGVAATMVSSNVAVIERGELPFRPWMPQTWLFSLLAAAAGLAGGVGLAFLVEHFDHTIKTSEEMEDICQLPSLGMIPLLSQNHKNNGGLGDPAPGLIVLQEPKSPVAEAIRHVRTSVLLSLSGRPHRTMVITSPNPGEGKSTLALNLAISLAMEDRPVALVDGDLRRPRLHRLLGPLPPPGLTDFLNGKASREDILKTTAVPNLWMIPAGPVPPSPTELLGSQSFRDLLDQLQQDFQHVLINTPPILGFADARILSTLVDGVLLVIKHHSTPRAAARLARQLLHQSHARVIGVVLNQVTTDKLGYGGYYYGYLKKYHKYYKEYQEI